MFDIPPGRACVRHSRIRGDPSLLVSGHAKGTWQSGRVRSYQDHGVDVTRADALGPSVKDNRGRFSCMTSRKEWALGCARKHVGSCIESAEEGDQV